MQVIRRDIRSLANTLIVRKPLSYCDLLIFFSQESIGFLGSQFCCFVLRDGTLTSSFLESGPGCNPNIVCNFSKCGVCPLVLWSTIFSLLAINISVVVSASSILNWQIEFLFQPSGREHPLTLGTCTSVDEFKFSTTS